MDLIITDPMPVVVKGNTHSPVKDYAPVYVERIVTSTNSIQIVVRFLPKSLGSSGGGVTLIE